MDDTGILISRQFAAEVECAEHGTPLGIVLIRATGPNKADEILTGTDSMLGVRHSGLLEVTDYQEFARFMGPGGFRW